MCCVCASNPANWSAILLWQLVLHAATCFTGSGSSSSDGSPVIDPVAAYFDVKTRIDLDTENKLEPSLSCGRYRAQTL
ncbi:hypothetical protein EV424DRAFT_1415948, partial [Suillus variegatus]